MVETPVTTPVAAATACAAADIGHPSEHDGLDLMPLLVEGKPLADRTLQAFFGKL
jgi:hypothetical protein